MFFVFLIHLIYFLIIIVHILLSRLKAFPKFQLNVLWLMGVLGGVVYWWISSGQQAAKDSLWLFPLRGSAFILYLLLFYPYYSYFTNADCDGPSQRILVLLKKYGRMTYDELLERTSAKQLAMIRLNDLCEHGFIQSADGRYSLLPKGVLLTRCVMIYQHLLGRQIRG